MITRIQKAFILAILVLVTASTIWYFYLRNNSTMETPKRAKLVRAINNRNWGDQL